MTCLQTIFSRNLKNIPSISAEAQIRNEKPVPISSIATVQREHLRNVICTSLACWLSSSDLHGKAIDPIKISQF
ncbi:hypothetical protein RB195_005148 [Necator americanus]